jgi:hypothetical protein
MVVAPMMAAMPVMAEGTGHVMPSRAVHAKPAMVTMPGMTVATGGVDHSGSGLGRRRINSRSERNPRKKRKTKKYLSKHYALVNWTA